MEAKYMERALELAKKGWGFVNPNPMVGAVIVKDGRIIGEGYHRYYGGDHAEVEAINSAKEPVEGSTIYVNLEPCCHYGKKPPCVEAIIAAGIKKVVISMLDPNPLVSGKGVEILRENGIEVITGVLEDKARKLNEIFVKYITTKIPFCLLKTAMSLDGKIATKFADSKWITNEEARAYVHYLRQGYSGIMVGINTIFVDNPQLTVRIPGFKGKNPIRIIVDSKCRIPLDAFVVKDGKNTKTIIATTEKGDKERIKVLEEMGIEVIITPEAEGKVDLKYLVKELGKKNIDSILLEGGGSLNYSAIKDGIVDKVNFFIAPKLIGGSMASTPVEGEGVSLVKDAFPIKDISIIRFGDDIMVEGYLEKR